MSIARLSFALTSSTITLWAIIGLIALAIAVIYLNLQDNEKTPNGRIVGFVKGMLAATCVLSFLTILATGLAFLYYSPLM